MAADGELFLKGKDESEMLGLRAAVWGEDHPHSQVAFTNWLFEAVVDQRPAGVIIRSHDVPVGFAGLSPKRLWVDGEVRRLAHGLDYMVRPGLEPILLGRTAVRVAQRWLNLARNSGSAAGLVFPNERSFRILTSRHVGLSPMFELALLVRPLRSVRMTQRVKRISCRVTTAALRAAAIVCSARAARQVRAPGELAEISGFGDEFDELWERASAHIRVGVIRDANYLTWRYIRHPIYEYERIALRDGDRLRGFAVGSARHVFGVDALLLVDFLAESGDDRTCAALILGLVRSAIERKRGMVAALAVPGSAHEQLLRRCGFLRVPRQFDPKPFRTAGIVFDGGSDVLRDLASWYFTWGDTDVV